MAMSRIESMRRLVKALLRDTQGINPQVSDSPAHAIAPNKAPSKQQIKAAKNRLNRA